MALNIFDRIDPPASHVNLSGGCNPTWLTWSEAFRQFLRDATSQLRSLAAAPLVQVANLGKYGITFSHSSAELTQLRGRLIKFAESLRAIRPRSKLFLLDHMIDQDIDAPELHALFALLRGTLVQVVGNEHAAMYTPLGRIGTDEGDFPLHADLYIPRVLLNVFDDVPEDASGASLFLSLSALRKLMSDIKSLPTEVANLIIAIIENDSKIDGFEVLYDLLHGPRSWVEELEQAMERSQLRIKLYEGQGYLLDDRKWLHGRDAPTAGVPANRLHRLVYSEEDSRLPNSSGRYTNNRQQDKTVRKKTLR